MAAVATSELRPVSAVLTSKGRGADVCRPPTVRQALSVIASGLPNRHPSRRDRRENRGSRLGEEGRGLRPPSQEVMERGSAPGLLEGCLQIPDRDRKRWGDGNNNAETQKSWCRWWGPRQAAAARRFAGLQLWKHLDNHSYRMLGAGLVLGVRREL